MPSRFMPRHLQERFIELFFGRLRLNFVSRQMDVADFNLAVQRETLRVMDRLKSCQEEQEPAEMINADAGKYATSADEAWLKTDAKGFDAALKVFTLCGSNITPEYARRLDVQDYSWQQVGAVEEDNDDDYPDMDDLDEAGVHGFYAGENVLGQPAFHAVPEPSNQLADAELLLQHGDRLQLEEQMNTLGAAADADPVPNDPGASSSVAGLAPSAAPELAPASSGGMEAAADVGDVGGDEKARLS